MNTEQLCDEVLTLSGAIGDICGDEEIYKAFVAYQEKAKGAPAMLVTLKLVSDILPLLLKNHRESVQQLLASIEGKPIEAIRKMNGAALAVDVVRAWKTELMPFFTQFGSMVSRV